MRIRRKGLASSIGLLVFAISLFASWRQWRDHFHDWDPQALTVALIEAYQFELAEALDNGSALPESLDSIEFSALNQALHQGPYPGLWSSARPGQAARDAWGRPLVYERSGSGFRILSLGADGEPGGRGYDADLESGRPAGPRASARFIDFLFEQPSGAMIETCGIAGLLSAATSLLLLRRRPYARRVFWPLLVNVLAAILVAVLLAVLHIPYVSGH